MPQTKTQRNGAAAVFLEKNWARCLRSCAIRCQANKKRFKLGKTTTGIADFGL